jgi:hypothetical protein
MRHEGKKSVYLALLSANKLAAVTVSRINDDQKHIVGTIT